MVKIKICRLLMVFQARNKSHNSHIHSKFCSWHLSLGKLTQLVQHLNSIIHSTAWLQWFWYKTKNDLCSRAYVSEIISSYFQSGFLLRPSLHWHHLSTPRVNYSGFNGRPSPWCNYAIRNRWFNWLFLVQQLSIDFLNCWSTLPFSNCSLFKHWCMWKGIEKGFPE